MEQNNSTAMEEQFSIARVIAVVQDVLRQWYLIVVVALIAGMCSFTLKNMTYVPQYSTSTTFVISAGGTSSTTFQNLSATMDLASVFTEILNSSLLREKVMEQVGIPSFDGEISASVVPNTNLLNMKVSGTDPRTVFLVSKAIQEHHGIVTDQVLGTTILEVLKQPTVPVAPENPLNLKSTMKKAAVMTGAAMAFVLGVLSFLSDKIRSRDEADNKLSCRVLGEVYHERKYKTLREQLGKRKTSILISNPTTSFAYTESISKLASRVENHLHRDEKIVMVTSFLENEGKSTMAVNLALAMSQKGRKVLLLDCDLRKPACALVLNQNLNTPGVAEILAGKANLKDAVTRVDGTGVYLVSSRKGQHTATDIVASPAMASIFKAAADLFDVVIVDTPPMSMAPDAECLSAMVDASLLVVRQNEALAVDLNDVAGILEKSSSHLLGCVLNNVYGTGNFVPAYHYGKYSSYKKYGRYGYGYGYGPRENRE